MTLVLAIVADDLTGALDTSTPLVLQGLSVAVAVNAGALDAALDQDADVVAVNTASRGMAAADAAAIVTDVAKRLVEANPAIVLKKVDSRLKGNPGAESAALAAGIGRVRLVVAPAVPDQGRPTIAGSVTGRGVEKPIPVAPLFADLGVAVEIVDASCSGDLDAIVAASDWSAAIAVGAAGLGTAFARKLGQERAVTPYAQAPRTLFAFGSRDPITNAQISRLAQAGVPIVDAPHGDFSSISNLALPLVVRCTGDATEKPEAVAGRFAGHVARAVVDLAPTTLVMGGGDTALAIFEALGIRVVKPRGEVAPGVPWLLIEMQNGQTLRCVVKSGGFGDAEVLAGLLPSGQHRARERSDARLG